MARKLILTAFAALAGASAGIYGLKQWNQGKSGKQKPEWIGYAPLDTLKPVADGIWIVDSGPIRPAGLSVPVRMTVMRLAGGELLLHSPTQMTGGLVDELGRHGRVRYFVAPTIGHWTFLPDWQEAFPGAEVWAIPGLRDRPQLRQSGLRIDAELDESAPAAWADEIHQGLIEGGAGFVEAFFFHRETRTLVLTDLIQNMEAEKLPPVTGFLAGLARATRGTTPAHVRMALRLNEENARKQVRHILSLQPDQVIFAHGKWFAEHAGERLQRAFGWFV